MPRADIQLGLLTAAQVGCIFCMDFGKIAVFVFYESLKYFYQTILILPME